MILADQHLHTAFSGDGCETMEAMCEEALKKGLKHLCFTDHMDIGYPEQKNEKTGLFENIFTFDTTAYRNAFLKVREQYSGRLQLRCGVELGLTVCEKEAVTAFAARHPMFDFIIGSSHLIGKADPYYPEYWRLHGVHEGILLYFQSILENIKQFDCFDSYGHLDYVVRYLPGLSDGARYSSCEYGDCIDEILKRLIQNGKALEINTAGYKHGLGQPNPCVQILRRYRELKGELITVGSDAHKRELLSGSFQQTEQLLSSLGYRYYAVFTEHSPQLFPLS